MRKARASGGQDGARPAHEARNDRWCHPQESSRVIAEPASSGIAGWLVVLLVVSAFGPYVVGGLRTDHLVVYPIAVLAGFSLLVARPETKPWAESSLWMVLSWAVLAGISVAGAIGGSGPMRWPQGSLFAGVDNMLMPLALVAVVAALSSRDQAPALLLLASRWVALLTAANAVLAIVMTTTDLNAVIGHWWGPGMASGGTGTVAELAGQNGRVTGIFNQPAEAGLMYGVGSLAAIYAFAKRPRLMMPILFLIGVGGILAVSKVYLLVALPLVVFLLLRGGRFVQMSLAVVGMLVLFRGGLLDGWTGGNQFELMLGNGQESALTSATAGRLGNGGTLFAVVDQVLRVSPWFGVGARGLEAPYDNGWIEALVVGGIVGVAAFTVTLLFMIVAAVRRPLVDKSFAVCLALLAVFTSVGLPALTANRSGLVLWLMVLLTVFHKADHAGEAVSPHRPGLATHGPAEVPGGDGNRSSRTRISI
jgi:hypothetical protein